MSTIHPQPADRTTVAASGPWVTGLALFAGILMIVVGIYHALGGIAAIIGDQLYVTTPDYTYTLDITSWGWIHLVLGAVIAVVGVGVVTGQAWARAVGVLVAALSMVANFMFVPYYPIWSVLMIALCVAVIWALAVWNPSTS
ncbi:DUF7144 family membrane protein [Pseudonocardia zijingensis]|uniref:DUF7144 domain-containing protein n=1 Tax=Pseudonocardia zijingensis TaxID=153376 RepID=A0ABP3ZKD6_9PSEU